MLETEYRRLCDYFNQIPQYAVQPETHERYLDANGAHARQLQFLWDNREVCIGITPRTNLHNAWCAWLKGKGLEPFNYALAEEAAQAARLERQRLLPENEIPTVFWPDNPNNTQDIPEVDWR